MTWRAYSVAFLPLVIGLALAALWQAGLWSNFILYVRSDAGTLFILAGILVSGIWLIVRRSTLALKRQRERALAQLQYEQAEAHRRFISRLDHEIKNPLTAIRASLANIDVNHDGHALATVRSQVDRLARLSADLRKLSDLERQPLEVAPVDVGQLLMDLVALARERAEGLGCRVRLTLPTAPWPLGRVEGDQDLLALALHNLLDNALKFCRTGDTIEARAFEDGAWVVVEIADTGPGISDEDLPHLGEELYRGSTARSVEGSGLGLALVQAIVTRHNGKMSVRSRVGQGTVVSLKLLAAR
jgi:two-component system OmpR family sensor kinase